MSGESRRTSARSSVRFSFTWCELSRCVRTRVKGSPAIWCTERSPRRVSCALTR